MEPALGLRVVRGPDWEWEDQDGGEGYVGTVVGLVEGGGKVIVQWDMGERCNYRCGRKHKFDLRVLDCAQVGAKHGSTECVSCKKMVYGYMWQCIQCLEAGSVCSKCYMAGWHSTTHYFVRIDHENGPRVKVSSRTKSRSVKAFGIFCGATVGRGRDWKWGDQDGGYGNTGIIKDIQDCNENHRCSALVQWNGGEKNKYRLGVSGKVDLCCYKPAFGGLYYPDHLPILAYGGGEKKGASEENVIMAGDKVRVDLAADNWKELEEERGLWDETMPEFIGTVGVVQHISESGVLMVNYPGLATLSIASAAVKMVEEDSYCVGDVVQVKEEKECVLREQKGHGCWRDEMTECLGEVGRVVKVLPSGDVEVAVGDRQWVFSPSSINRTTRQQEPSGDGSVQLSEQVKGQLESLEKTSAPELVVAAAAAGDVNYKVKGRTGLMAAVAEGWPEAVKLLLLLEFKADVNQQDDDGDTALHYCAHLDQEDIAKELLSHGANPNITNSDGGFPLLYATALGHYGVMGVLLDHKKCNLNLQDKDGNTALHAAVAAHRSKAVRLLLDAGADPTVMNKNNLSPILSTGINGFYLGLERFIETHLKEVAGQTDKDGNTVLHSAVSNNHFDLVCLLTDKEACKIEAANTVAKETALHVAAREGHTRMIEHLLVHKANPDVTDGQGLTPLRLVIASKDIVKTPSEFSPLTCHEMQHSIIKPLENYKAVCCLLVKYGANFDRDVLINQHGCSNDLITSLALCTEKRSNNQHSISP